MYQDPPGTAIRRRRLPLIIEGFDRSSRVMLMMIASTRARRCPSSASAISLSPTIFPMPGTIPSTLVSGPIFRTWFS